MHDHTALSALVRELERASGLSRIEYTLTRFTDALNSVPPQCRSEALAALAKTFRRALYDVHLYVEWIRAEESARKEVGLTNPPAASSKEKYNQVAAEIAVLYATSS